MPQSAETARSSQRPRRRWFRYSLRTLIVVLTVASVVLGVWIQRVERQRQAVTAVRRLGGTVWHEDDIFQSYNAPPARRPPLSWLRLHLGDDYFANVDAVSLDSTEVSDAWLEYLKAMRGLRRLDLNNTQISDAGLAHLKRLTGLQELNLGNTRVTDAGVAELHAALPDCTIWR